VVIIVLLFLKVPKIDINNIENNLSYKFNDKSILELAFTHSSVKKTPNNYERLEFLGDSIIDFVISDWLFRNNKNINQGELTIIKNTYISRKNLSLIASRMDLISYTTIHKSVKLDSKSVTDRINADLYESLVAAIYLDSNYNTVKKFIHNTLLFFPTIKEINYKGKLNEKCHQIKINEPTYTLISNQGPDHSKKYKVKVLIDNKSFFGNGTKIQEAEVNAARKALIDLFSF